MCVQRINPYFAVKRSYRKGETFRRELSTHKNLVRQDHPHLMKLLVTYQYQDRYHMLFRWADENLHDFWKKYPRPDDIPRTHSFATWVFQQLVGLTSGLKAILLSPSFIADDEEEDNYATGNVHANLKPDNILWFEQIPEFIERDEKSSQCYGRLFISDFGRVHIDFPEDRFVSGTYGAPEFEKREKLTQSYDIWTLGCVILDFVVWYLGGVRDIYKFSEDRVNEPTNGHFQTDDFFHTERKTGRDGQPIISATLKVSVAKVRRIQTHGAT